MKQTAADRIAVALDLPDVDSNVQLVRQLTGRARWFKVGMRLFYSDGSGAVFDEIKAAGARLFLDLKLHDIPKTVGDAAASLARFRPELLTVHAAGGRAMVSAAVDAAGAYDGSVIAVTVLTSLDASDLAAFGADSSVSDAVVRLGKTAIDAGAAGLVCSGWEAESLRVAFPEATLVTPGIRLPGGDAGDQKRVMTPARALAAGASLLVVGRPIHGAADRATAFDSVISAFE